MIKSAHILVVDDEEIMRDSCYQILTEMGHHVVCVENGHDALNQIKKEIFDVIILDLKMPGLSGMDVLRQMITSDPDAIVIVITGYATVDSAVQAMKTGAFDFLPKPFNPGEFRIIVQRALEKRALVLENLYLKGEIEISLEDAMIGQSQSIKKIKGLIQKAGPTDSTVLITGESGTGKEIVARSIHAESSRKDNPFVTVDCGSLVENLFESELFGHVKGAFTGATKTQYGRFELANTGTIFFDEVGNITTQIQAKLLRAVQEREINRIGSAQTVQVNVRIIAATNMDLASAVAEGNFREDLFYRLGVIPIDLPPLRARKKDIPLLVDFFINKYNKKRKKKIQGISKDALETLLQYDWPGNIRELENTIERAVVLSDQDVIQSDDLWCFHLTVQKRKFPESFEMKSLEELEKEHIKNTLAHFNGQKMKTANALGVDRKTLWTKLKKYGFDD